MVAVIDADADSRAALEKALKKEGLESVCRVIAGGEEGLVGEFYPVYLHAGMSAQGGLGIHFNKPVRLGAVLAAVLKISAGQSAQSEVVNFGPYALDIFNHTLQDKNGNTTRLTEKESRVLVLLAAAKGGAVTRKTLLEDVWNYADDIETHTLETHIYRLRQKIEQDPANPKFLLTDVLGYRLNI